MGDLPESPMSRFAFWLPLLAACNDYGVTAHNAVPTVRITSPADGDTPLADVPLELLGLASDADDDRFDATWRVDDTVACGPAPTDVEGATRCLVNLTPGPHDITLTVVDPNGGTAADHVTVVAETDPPPQIAILAPLAAGRYYADAPVTLDARLSDDGDPAALDVAWESALSGPLDVLLTLDGDRTTGALLLPEGTHALTARVTDPAGGTDTDQVEILVGPANRAPTCTIVAPLDGAAGAIGASVTLTGLATDEDQPSPELAVSWASDRDGLLASPIAEVDGTATSEVSLSPGAHQLTLEVTDERGAACTTTVRYTLGDAPGITVLAPTDGAVFAEGAPVTLSAVASDGEDAADTLVVAWTSDRDGTLAILAPDAAGGVEVVTSDLSRGPHVSTVTVTDTDGYSTQAVSTFTVDGLPSAPTVVIHPATPRTDDDLVLEIVTPSVDPDGDPVVTTTVWLRDGVPTALVGATVPHTETAAGEVWTVQVTPNDGWFAGPAGQAEVEVRDSPPEVTSLGLSPVPASTDDVLTCTATAVDPDGDVVILDIRWTVDGAPAGAAGPTLDGGWFSRDETVACTVTPNDGTSVGPAVATEVVISNSPPSAPGLDLSPAVPDPDDALWCSVDSASNDADGDSVIYTFAWSRDGAPWTGPTATTVVAGDTIPASVTSDGDGWACVVTPSDGTDDGPVGVASVGIACAASTWFVDADTDGYGETSSATAACAPPGAGWVLVGGDCDDGDPAVNPTQTEWCDGIDNDCDGTTDEPQAADAVPWYLDADGDNHGDPLVSFPGCSPPAGTVSSPTDCDDTDPTIWPEAGDLAFDGVDSDCDGMDCEAARQGSVYLAVCFGPLGWHDARLECLLAGYDDLASVRDASEQATIVGMLADAGATSTHAPWIGYADEVIESLWGWSDLSTSTYTAWGPGEPNGGNQEDCAELNWPLGTGTWNDADCYDTSAHRGWVCEAR